LKGAKMQIAGIDLRYFTAKWDSAEQRQIQIAESG